MTTRALVPEMDAEAPNIKALSAEQARQLRLAQPPLSPWWVVAGQLLAGALVALAAVGLTGRWNVGWSAAYGSLAVVIPAALFARGLMGQFSSLNAGTAVLGFFLWELVKIGVSVVLIAMAPKLVAGLHWPAMLVGLVVTLKVYWVALLVAPRKAKSSTV